MRKNRRLNKPRFKCYRCLVTYFDYEFDGERFQSRTLHFAVKVDYYASFVQLLENSFLSYSISRLSTFYSPVNRDFYSLI
jgi:hypothetical protein